MIWVLEFIKRATDCAKMQMPIWTALQFFFGLILIVEHQFFLFLLCLQCVYFSYWSNRYTYVVGISFYLYMVKITFIYLYVSMSFFSFSDFVNICHCLVLFIFKYLSCDRWEVSHCRITGCGNSHGQMEIICFSKYHFVDHLSLTTPYCKLWSSYVSFSVCVFCAWLCSDWPAGHLKERSFKFQGLNCDWWC